MNRIIIVCCLLSVGCVSLEYASRQKQAIIHSQMLKELKQQSNKSIYPGYTRNGQLGEYITKGDVYLGQSKYNLAISTYKKALELDPKNVHTLNNLGNAYYKQGKYDLAMSTCKKMLELDPKNVYALNNLGSLYYIQDKYNLAIPTYKKALELNPKNVYALKGLERIRVSQSKANQ